MTPDRPELVSNVAPRLRAVNDAVPTTVFRGTAWTSRGATLRGKRTWALVMSGVRARILRDVEDSDGEEPVEIVSKAQSTHLRDLLTDKPGRSFSSGSSGRRSRMEPGSDPVLRDMQEFAAETAEVLEHHRRAGDFERLAVFAEPKMLGILRAECPAALWSSVCLDLPINLISLPPKELRERVLELIRERSRSADV